MVIIKSNINSFYNSLIYMLLIIGIDVIPRVEAENKMVKYISKMVSFGIITLLLSAGVYIAAVLHEGFQPSTVLPLITFLYATTFYFSLYKDRRKLYLLLKKISYFQCSSLCKRKFSQMKVRISILSVLLILTLIVLLSIQLNQVLQDNSVQVEIPHRILSKIHLNNRVFVVVFFAVSPHVYFLLPFSIFLVFYLSISWHINVIILHFKQAFSSRRHDLLLIQNHYVRIRRLVNFTNSVLSKHILLCTLQISTAMYGIAFTIIKDGIFKEADMIISFCHFFTIFSLFAVTMFIASAIPNSNSEILNVANEISLTGVAPEQVLVLSFQIQQGLCLTVGGIVSIRQGFFFALIGTVTTYSFLIRSFSTDF